LLDISIEHHLSSGHRRSSSESSAAAAWQRSRQGERERGDDAGERGGKRPVGPTEPLVEFDQKAGADRWAWPDRWARAGRERGEREKFLIKILKIEIELKRRVFLEKLFNTQLKIGK
jgi:hypothetical protein